MGLVIDVSIVSYRCVVVISLRERVLGGLALGALSALGQCWLYTHQFSGNCSQLHRCIWVECYIWIREMLKME